MDAELGQFWQFYHVIKDLQVQSGHKKVHVQPSIHDLAIYLLIAMTTFNIKKSTHLFHDGFRDWLD